MNARPETSEKAAEQADHRLWELPAGPGCARFARSVLVAPLGALRVPDDVVGDAQLMVSELVTNAHQHAAEHGPHELWLDVERSGIVCAVFDGLADGPLPGYSWTSGDFGRGLGIVHGLSAGHWGTSPARSRLGRPRPGKAVWFTVPGHVVPPPPGS